MTITAVWWRSEPEPGQFLPPCDERSTIGTRAAASRGADYASPRGIISATGPTGARPRCRTSPPASPGGARGGLSGCALTRRGAPVPAAGRAPAPRHTAACCGARRSRQGAAGASRLARPAHRPADGCPSWLGEGLNVGWAIDVLHPLAQSSRPCPAERGSPAAHPSTVPLAATPPPRPE